MTLCLAVVWFGIEDDVPGAVAGGFDWSGLALVTVAIGLVMAGLIAIRVQGPGSVLPWLLIAGRGWRRSCRSGASRPATTSRWSTSGCWRRPASGPCS